ncbi:LamG domain-containing protein, partial [Candidatus Woesearchaeota archaeon]|nr:LamG domain-containing protein [Candidatus Woesearchaeota archaeon]
DSAAVETTTSDFSDTFGSDLKAFYSFNDGVNDLSDNHYDGSVTGGVVGVTDVSEDIERLYAHRDLNGADGYVTVASVSQPNRFECAMGCSISAWVRPTTLAPAEQQIFDHDKASDRGFYFNLISGGGLRFLCGKGGEVTAYQTTDASDLISLTDWTFVTAVFSGNVAPVKVYVNGAEVSSSATGTFPASCNIADNPTSIGMSNYAAPASFFGGSVDEVRFYSSAISSDIVELLYLQPDYNIETSMS